MVFINGWWEALPFTVPVAVATRCRQIVCDTFDPARIGVIDRHMQVAGRSVVIPRRHQNADDAHRAMLMSPISIAAHQPTTITTSVSGFGRWE